MAPFKLEGIKYDPNAHRVPNMLYCKKNFNEKVKVENWYSNFEYKPIDVNPYNPKCFRLQNSHYHRLGTENKQELISEYNDVYRRKEFDANVPENKSHKSLINFYTYKPVCSSKNPYHCPKTCNDYLTTMQESYSSPFPYALNGLMLPKVGNENKRMKEKIESKFLDDNFRTFSKKLQQVKGFRHNTEILAHIKN